jgi:hypothetical protein
MEHWDWKRYIHWYKGRIFVFLQIELKSKQILSGSHDSLMEGQLGFLKTYKGINNNFLGGGNKERY